MGRRVVITGMGVLSANAVGVPDFVNALKEGRSGIRFYPRLRNLKFRSQIGGIPDLDDNVKEDFIRKYNLTKMKSSGIVYGCMAGVEAWEDAGFSINSKSRKPDWDSGCIFGTECSGGEAIDYGIRNIDTGNVRKLGGRTAQQAMNSGVSAYIGGILGLGNQVTTNSSAANTGTESVLVAYNRIKSGLAKRMVAGSCESNTPYIWAFLDAISPLAYKYNDLPWLASCPMSANINGPVPASGAGALIIENLASARKRKARIYAEILGGSINSGGQRNGGNMVRSGFQGMADCICDALKASRVHPKHIDLISGHLASDCNDITEIKSLAAALGRSGKDFPWINAPKSMTGYSMAASGSIEIVAAVLQLYQGFIHPTPNCKLLHPEIETWVHSSRVPQKAVPDPGLNIVAKLSYGFGDVNSCIILKKWAE